MKQILKTFPKDFVIIQVNEKTHRVHQNCVESRNEQNNILYYKYLWVNCINHEYN